MIFSQIPFFSHSIAPHQTTSPWLCFVLVKPLEKPSIPTNYTIAPVFLRATAKEWEQSLQCLLHWIYLPCRHKPNELINFFNSPDRSARGTFDGLGIVAWLAASPPCAFTERMGMRSEFEEDGENQLWRCW